LLLTVVACVLGTATAAACGCGLDPGLALTAGVLAVLAHAAGNVINDLHDARNGADAANLQPMTPFAGGSRLIQQGLVSERQTAEVAWGLMLLVRHRQDTGRLRPALALSVAAVQVHGLGMAAGFWQVTRLH
ncbi:MAG: hypothetical protein ACLGH2_11190, partial [Gammaproteobacteria bacterium]